MDKKFLLILIGVIVFLFFVLFFLGSYIKLSSTEQQLKNVQQVIDANVEPPILKKIELVSCKSDYSITTRGYEYYYSPKLITEWKNISGRPITETIFIGVTMINNKTGKEMYSGSKDLNLSYSTTEFLPNTIRKLEFTSEVGGTIKYVYEEYRDISCHIYIKFGDSKIYYKEIKFQGDHIF